jgi:hypothetical protein
VLIDDVRCSTHRVSVTTPPLRRTVEVARSTDLGSGER